MPSSKYIDWQLEEQTTEFSTRSTSWELQRQVMAADKMVAGRDYMVYAWANCFSPGTNDGATKWAFIGGNDLPGSTQERYDTNSSGMAICHLGTFTAPDPVLPVGIYRKLIEDGGENEETKAGQFFIVDVSEPNTGSAAQFPFMHVTDYGNRVFSIGETVDSITGTMQGGAQCLVLASAKVYGGHGEPVTLGLYHDGTLVSSGSRYAVDTQDNNQVILGGVYNMSSGDVFEIRNNDDRSTVTTTYTYMSIMNIGVAAAACDTGRLSTWTDLGGSGRWTPTTATSDSGPSFVFTFGRQEATGIGSGRQASISVKNNTQGTWMNFPYRPSGDFSPLYFPATEVGIDVGQYSTAAVVGYAAVGDHSYPAIASGDEIQVYTI